MRIGIAGAGIAGLAAALALLRAGFEVEVYEQAAALGDVGAGLQLSPNGTRVLRALGLEDALRPLVVEPSGKEVRLWNTGQRWKLFDLGEDCRQRFGAPYWMVHRADLHRVLFAAVHAQAADAIRLDARVVTMAQDASGVRVELADGSSRSIDGLLCADGVHSRLREQLLPGSERADFTGLMAWRGLAPAHRLTADFRAPVGTNWVGPGGHVITYPVRGGEMVNFVCIAEREDWRAESWSDPGTHDEMIADFVGWNAGLLDAIRQVEQPFKWALLGREPRRGWAQGRACLIGDAAHPTLPFLAQGANMCLEDAAVIANCVANADGPEAAFRRFEELRWQRTADIVNGSRANAARFHNRDLADPVKSVEYVDREWEPEKVRRRYDWLFDYDALQIGAT